MNDEEKKINDLLRKRLSEIGKKGGAETAKRHGQEYYKTIGRLGGLKKGKNYHNGKGGEKI